MEHVNEGKSIKKQRVNMKFCFFSLKMKWVFQKISLVFFPDFSCWKTTCIMIFSVSFFHESKKEIEKQNPYSKRKIYNIRLCFFQFCFLLCCASVFEVLKDQLDCVFCFISFFLRLFHKSVYKRTWWFIYKTNRVTKHFEKFKKRKKIKIKMKRKKENRILCVVYIIWIHYMQEERKTCKKNWCVKYDMTKLKSYQSYRQRYKGK